MNNTPEMSLREYAAITLKVPESGTDWLDDMIRKSLRDDFAGKAIKALLPTGVEKSGFTKSRTQCPTDAYKIADEMLAARDNGNIDEWMEEFRERHELILCSEDVQKLIEYHRLEKDVFLRSEPGRAVILNPRKVDISKLLDDLREWSSPIMEILVGEGMENIPIWKI